MYQRKRALPGYGQPFQDQRGYWNIQIANGTKRGRTVYKRIRCKTLEGLKAKRKEFENKRARGQVVDGRSPCLAPFLRTWIEQTVKTRNRFRTYERYKGIVEQYLIPHLDPRSTRKVEALERTHVQDMINDLVAKGLAVRTVRNIRAVLRRALNVAMIDGTILRNVAKAADIPPEPSIKRRTLTPTEARWLLEAVAGHWLKALYWAALLMGFREGELCGMRLDDIDLDKGVIYPNKGIQRQKREADKPGKLVEVELKTEASQEPLVIPAPLIAVLRDHLSYLEVARTQSTWVESGMLFPNSQGKPMEPRNLVRHFKATLCKWNKADADRPLPDIPFHNLRHTCGTLLAEMGVHTRVIQAVLRHASYYTTAKFYVHSRDAVQAAAVEGLGAMLTEPERVLEMPEKVTR